MLVTWLIGAGVDPERLHAGVLQRSLIGVALIWLTATAVHLRQPDHDPNLDVDLPAGTRHSHVDVSTFIVGGTSCGQVDAASHD